MNTTTRKLTHSALMIALALVLSMIKLFHLANGGSITPASMAPIILIALMYPTKWALLTSFVYSLVQMVEGFYAPPTQDFMSFVLVILLDYVLAFGILGCAGLVARLFKDKKILGACVATIAVIFARFFCSFLSGIVIWGVYAPEGPPVWLYSLGVNGSVMLGEMVTTTIAMAVLVKFLPLDKLAAKEPAEYSNKAI